MNIQDQAPVATNSMAFLLDVDNTLLQNDQLKEDLAARVRDAVGDAASEEFWKIYEEVRSRQEYVDYPTTVKLWAERVGDPQAADRVRQILDSIDFRSYLYPDVLETIAHLWSIGTVAILSDGDSVFQPEKIRASGLEEAVKGNVLIFVHKELELPKVFARLPASHYVMVDDKPRILSALEECCPTTFTTVLVLQGKYAIDGQFKPEPDYVVNHIGDLRSFSREDFLDLDAEKPKDR